MSSVKLFVSFLLFFIFLIPITTKIYADELQTDLTVDLSITLAAGSIWSGIYMGKVNRDTQLHTQSTQSLSTLDTITPKTIDQTYKKTSDILLYSTIGVTLGVQLYLGKSEWAQRLLLFSEIFMINGLITDLTKHAVRRPRPFTQRSEVQGIDDELSFFSGHTSFVGALTFSTAHIINIIAPLSYWERVGLYGTAAIITSSVGAFRVLAAKHYPTDVLVGGVVGGCLGILIPELHKKSRTRLSTSFTEDEMFLVLQGSF